MKYLKTFKIFENSTESYSVGDVVNINYWVTGEPTPVVIKSIKSDGNGRKLYVVSHNLSSKQDFLKNVQIGSQFQNAPDQTVSSNDIINSVSKINTPAGPNYVADNPGGFNSQQVSNDMYL